MTAGVGLVVRADGSGCRLVEFDGAGRVVGQGERIRLSETTIEQSLSTTTSVQNMASAADAELARLLAKVRAQLSDGATLTGTDQDPQAAFAALAQVVGGYREAARRRPDLAEAARMASYLDDRPRGV
jgi:hypothetical protein